MRHTHAVSALAVLALPVLAAAQTPAVLVEQGDTVLGMGAVQSQFAIAITEGRQWLNLIDTTLDDPNQDGALLLNGFLAMREGMTLAAPANATLDDWTSVDINSAGNIAFTAKVRIPGVSVAKEALYYNFKLLALEGGPVNSPLVGGGTTWDALSGVRINDANEILALGKVANPIVTGAKEDTLSKFVVDPQGNVLSFTILATKGQAVPALAGAVIGTLATAKTAIALNNHGDEAHFMITNGGSPVILNMTTVLAQEGLPSSAGVNWKSLSSTKVALNDRGDTIVAGAVDSLTNGYLIEKNRQKFAREGDILPLLSSEPITAGNSAPIALDNSGNVYWLATTATKSAFMRNDAPLILAGSTQVEGALVTGLESSESSLAISRSGRFFMCSLDLGLAGSAVVIIDFGLVAEIPGCSGNAGRLTVSAGAPRVGQNMEFSLDVGHVAPAVTRINFSTRQRVPGSECGVDGPFGEVLIDLTHRIGSLFPPVWNGTGPVKVSAPIPNDLALVNATVFAQGQFRKPGTRLNTTLTNALRIEIGAP